MKLRLKKKPDFSVDMTPMTPEFCLQKSIAEIEKQTLNMGGHSVDVGNLFEVIQDTKEVLEITGACEQLNHVGAAMTQGELQVSGDIGHYAAAELSGGVMRVRGHVGDFCGHAMSGGRVIVQNNAGNFCGGAVAGAMQGMRGGEIIILGNAGERIGDHIRRGLIAIRGNAEDFCATQMKAGTIVVSGQCGSYCGQAMRRGSIILRQLPNGGMPQTFIDQNKYFETEFLTLLSNYLQNLDVGFEPLPLPKLAHRYMGDRAVNGKGEILILHN